MQLPQPYLFTSPRTVALVDRPVMAPAEGPVADSVYGYHTLWAAEVPFVPAFVGGDEGDFDAAASNRITRVLQRQVRFLYDLAQSRENASTFELRLISRPRPSGLARVGMAFLGKTFAVEENHSRYLAAELWDKFSAVFPREAPFSYPLVPVREAAGAGGAAGVAGEDYGFTQWHQPIAFDRMRVVELRKYEDWPTIRDIGGVLHARDYIPHPFVAALDYSAMARLFETMARQRQVCVVAITVRPQRLSDQEVVILHEMAGWFQRAARGDVTVDNPLVEVLRELKSDVFDAYLRTRAELGKSVYESLVREHRSLFLVRLQVIGDQDAQDDLVEALGSEVMANAGNAYPSRWTRVEPDERDRRWARFNTEWLEFVRWGISPLVKQAPAMMRLRQLATVPEVAGAFRLPVAPSGGGLAGVEVRDEPFVPPAALPGPAGDDVPLGPVLDRGLLTEAICSLPGRAVFGRTYVFGEASEAREAAVCALLAGAAATGARWALIRAAGDTGDAIAAWLGARCVSAAGPAMGRAPGFHPFVPPTDVPLVSYQDAIARVLTAAYELDANTAIVLRRALAATYELSGWSDAGDGRGVDLTRLPAAVDAETRRPEVPPEVGAAVRASCVLPLQDLAATCASLFGEQTVGRVVWSEPLVVETGWIGAATTQAAIRGALWAWLALAAAGSGGGAGHARPPRGVVALEDAHGVFGGISGERGGIPASATDTLAQMAMRGGVGTLLIDDRPDLFPADSVSGAAALVLTRTTNVAAAEHAGRLIGATPRQQARLGRLGPREAVVVTPGFGPTLVALTIE